ncbi:recombinase family protein [Psychromonas sp. Urea-02u-13]|uniref:recombinase family protein n=1 Tax=Psychromonas sp. Urea-02u-13 TaxID=2058326 RepID=UPI000C320254|nr:recombinase family protein [Psychromonas sp. Urea-02u-13]PKG40206.1 resolvase [Psychromonas sp. Urea-02u-13]
MSQVAYIRVSSTEQNTDRQLADTGIEFNETFTDKCSAGTTNRPKLEEMRRYLRKGDTVHVHSIDRLARDLMDLQGLVKEWIANDISVKFHKESLEFSSENNTAMNELMLTMLGAVAQFERSMIKERQAEGIAKAKAKGVYKGRKANSELHSLIKVELDKGLSIRKTATKLGCNASTVQTVKKAM